METSPWELAKAIEGLPVLALLRGLLLILAGRALRLVRILLVLEIELLEL